jgi:dienelactone hydrolase
MWKVLLASLALAVGLAPAQKSAIYKIPYEDRGTALEGRLVLPQPRGARLPLVVLYPDWMGVTSRAVDDAQRIAGWGYAVFVADPYGVDAQPRDAAEAGPKAGAIKADLPGLRARARAALDAALKREEVDTGRVAALGFCFGGALALELARSGAPLKGAASVHGNLKTALPGDARNIRGAILALHGAEDPYVPAEEVGMFVDEMRAAGVDWQLVSYGGAVHAFTNPGAGSDPAKGAAWHPKAASRAFSALQAFFGETLAAPPKKKKR